MTCHVLPETVVALEWSGQILVCWWGDLIYLSSRSTYFVFLIAQPLCRRDRKWQRITRQTCWLDFTVSDPAWLSGFLRHEIKKGLRAVNFTVGFNVQCSMETAYQWSNAELSFSICYFHQLNRSIIIITTLGKTPAHDSFNVGLSCFFRDSSQSLFYFKPQEIVRAKLPLQICWLVIYYVWPALLIYQLWGRRNTHKNYINPE